MNSGTVTIGNKTWTVSIATTPADISAGFSNIPSTPANTGILFNLGGAFTNLDINMQLMLFPLDIAFIDRNGKVVDIAHNLPPLQDFICLVPCNYFLEVNAGELSNVNIGDTVTGLPSTDLLSRINIGSIIEVVLIMMIIKMITLSMK